MDEIAFAGGSPTAMCRSCHADDPPHQVGLEPDKATVPAGFPLPGGRLSCVTCHDEAACDGSEQDPANPRFWRGGPYAHMGDLCHRCHGSTDPERYDPHTAMAEHPGDASVCGYCHEPVPARDAAAADVRVGAQSLCLGCHQGSHHAGADAHLRALDPEMAARAQAAGLPLGADGKAECATCHDVHPAGSTAMADARRDRLGKRLMPVAWATDVLAPSLSSRAGSPAPATEEPDFLRRPLVGGDLCRSCHDPREIEAARAAERSRP